MLTFVKFLNIKLISFPFFLFYLFAFTFVKVLRSNKNSHFALTHWNFVKLDTRYFWLDNYIQFRNRRSVVYVKIVARKNFTEFLGKHLSQSLFLLKLQAPLEKKNSVQPVNFANFSRTSLLQITFGRLILPNDNLLEKRVWRRKMWRNLLRMKTQTF